MAQPVKLVHGGKELPVAFCSPKDGRFLSAAHSYCDCSISLSSCRGNDEVFTLILSSHHLGASTNLVQIRTSQKLYVSLGSSAWLIKKAVQLQRTQTLDASLHEKQAEVRKTLSNEAAAESSARERIEILKMAIIDLQNKSVGNSGNQEREQQNLSNSLETLEKLEKQLNAARNEYSRIMKPWHDAKECDDDLQRKIERNSHVMQKIDDFGCDCIDIERPLGAFLKPSEWKILKSDGGMVAIYSPILQAFLKTDLSLSIPDEPFDDLIGVVPPECSWLMLPVPLQCRPGNVEASFSAMKLMCIGRESFVFACAQDCMHEHSVIKSLVRPDAARRIEDLLYEANMPAAPDFSDVLCPVLFNSYSTMPAMFLTQRRCGRNLVEICQQVAELSTLEEIVGPTVPFNMAIRITHRICKITQYIHNLGFLILDISPSNFCENVPGDPLSLLMTDFREVRRYQRMTYSTPNYMKTSTGGRIGVLTGEWKMMPFSSAFLDNLDCNSFFASNEILRLPGSIDLSADVFSIACILVWMTAGVVPSNIANSSKSVNGESTLQARNEVLQNLKTVFEPKVVKGVMVPNSSSGSKTIASVMRTPQLAELVMLALSEIPERRPALPIFTAALEQFLNSTSTFTESE